MEYRDYRNIPEGSDEENLSLDLKPFLDWVKDDQPYKQIFLGGHFVGASLVFLNLNRLEGQDDGAIVFSPFSSQTDTVKYPWLRNIFIIKEHVI